MPTHLRRADPIRRLLRATLAVAGGVALALVTVAGSYAYLSRTTTVPGGTITAGSAGFTISTGSAVALTGLYPGATQYGTYTLTNTGDVSLALSISSFDVTPTSAFASAVVIDLAVHPAGSTCASAAYTQVSRTGSTTTGTLAGPLPSRDRYTPGSASPTRTLCVRASLPVNAPDGAKATSGSYAVVIRGVQP
jgi:hypothetical protein